MARRWPQYFCALFICMVLMRTDAAFQLQWSLLRFGGRLFGKMVKNGFSAGMQSSLDFFSSLVLCFSINPFGTTAVAANTAYDKMDDHGRLWHYICNLCGTEFWYPEKRLFALPPSFFGRGAGSGTCFLSFSDVFIFLFLNDAAVNWEGVRIMRHIWPFFFMHFIVRITLSLRGTGGSVIHMVFTAVRICLLYAVWVTAGVPHFSGVLALLWSHGPLHPYYSFAIVYPGVGLRGENVSWICRGDEKNC